MTRFGQYCALRDAGYNRFQATTGVQNISVNFNRSGANSYLGKNIIFAKAAINALTKAVYLGKTYPKAFWTENAAIAAVGFMLNYFWW
jgi:hypothetical protein